MGPCTLMSWCAAWNSALYCACVHRGNALLPVPKLTTWSAWLTQVVAVGSAACMLLRICCTAGQARPRTLPVRGTVRLPSDTCRVHPVCQPGRCLSKLANGCHVRAGFLSQALTRKTNHVRTASARPAGS